MLLSTSFSASKAQVLDPTQQYITGNVVLPTVSGSTPWVNGVYQDSLTCWAWGDPGYCGPNPIVRPGNNINFSYGTTDLYQSQYIAGLLPNSGTGLVVNGFNFSFMAKNGNGWDDGRIDALNAYVQFYGSNFSLLKNYNYNLNYNFNWTNFNFSESFSSPLSTSQLSTVRYGFVGRDNNFWAGPYGPEISDVSFSLKYSVDPCSVNILSSPSCPGYLTELAKLSPPQPVAVSEPIISAPVVVETIVQPVQQQTPTLSSQPSPSSTTTPAVAEQEKKTTPSTSTVLSIIRNIQQNDALVQKSAVQNALSEAAFTSTQSQQEALSIAEQAQSASIAIANQAAGGSSSSSFTSSGQGTGLSITNSSINSFTKGIEIEVSQTDSRSLTNRTDPINQILQARTEIQAESSSNQSSQIRRNVPNNELAGAVNIASIATVPPGFDLYSTTLKDALFYAPKEIYKGQKTVDNERVLRQLNRRSDAIFDQMINEQYK